MEAVRCHKCNSLMVMRQSTNLRHHDGTPKRFLFCTGFPKCNNKMSVHPDGTRYGTPADADTTALRRKAHQIFDQLWKCRLMTRDEAYRRLCGIMGMTKEQAHISNFNKEQCQKLIDFLGTMDARPVGRNQRRRSNRRFRHERMKRGRNYSEEDGF